MSCPICGKPTETKYRPFCSGRCADVDLARWMSGSYAVPSTDPQDVEEALEAAERELSRLSDTPTKQTRH
ncbi:DNA gyrase inhibitor YacG [Salipiger marinus]|mgnify:CR=1 FL=1|jgi:uncharacterized protein|uniref:DNA gyrase inhibitor YacG n=1 Tax=Salipiger marinus TaxID=555512 RepID=A0A1G8IQC3_9RHOB|nr:MULTISPECIES: DNA gyrase inhibitor YacG [Salipiger]HBM61058.1 DNA gyrase inhibitor YacG [Citreicella sp.]MCD1618216.1 DNA gyrase inhibitor YacG [Salipiger manganoxidans]MEB3418187.1 DNA gyrase inhibitor YacG [Salipiger manganoxidans]SDI20967.1 hypothetical protein SAMN04487993_100244 [Salipiger marinus]HBS99015.1 DNA gyrase inhibitor YacG [Citreicella sp.]|tara:strand:+ start:267 stop:476 length:210 start_codon:yes stop_codon:yes gene_type:complete